MDSQLRVGRQTVWQTAPSNVLPIFTGQTRLQLIIIWQLACVSVWASEAILFILMFFQHHTQREYSDYMPQFVTGRRKRVKSSEYALVQYNICTLFRQSLLLKVPRIYLFDIYSKSSMRYGSFKILSNSIYPLT